MSKTSYEQYAKDIQNLVRQLPKKLTREQEEQIGKIYLKAFKDLEKKLEKCTDNKYRQRLLRAYQTQIYDELYPLIKQGIIDETEAILNIQKESMADLLQEVLENQTKIVEGKHKLQVLVDITNKELVEQMIKGNIYYNGRGLDEMLWDATKCSKDKLNLAITSCIAEGMGAAEMAENLKQFAMGGHHTWSKNKIREKLGSGYARKYSGGLDYESLRLARTTITHQAQIAVINTKSVNPYMGGVKWHSNHEAGRTCDLCNERDGHIFIVGKDEIPLDHPNGACWLEPVWMINGKEATPEDIAKDMKAWANGEPNSGLMDTIYENENS
nr:MAG TPA: minor capsid protein [Caudoviricetes sp.]